MPAGAPFGNNNPGKNKPWRDALNVALARYEKGDVKKGQALRTIAFKVVEQAIDGSRDAINEVANRLDGKPHQSMAIAIDDVTEHSKDEMRSKAVMLGMDPDTLFDEPSDSPTAH